MYRTLTDSKSGSLRIKSTKKRCRAGQTSDIFLYFLTAFTFIFVNSALLELAVLLYASLWSFSYSKIQYNILIEKAPACDLF